MKYPQLALCIAITSSCAFVPARGQLQHFNPVSNTGENATLIVPTSANPSIDGVPLVVGDEVGVFSSGGINTGAGVWEGEDLGITIWGDDTMSPEIDGMVDGDTILIRVWDQSADDEIGGVIVTYSQGNGLYSANALLTLSSLNADTSLPVELADLEAVVDHGDVILSWKTLSELNNAGFEIQHRREDDPTFWQTGGFVNGHGTTSEEIGYSFRVVGIDYGRHVFRLRQVDMDGSVSYSPEVSVSVDVATGFRLDPAWPNPCSSSATISFEIPEMRSVTVTLADVLGREIVTLLSGTLGTGRHVVTFDAADVPSGVYFYRLAAGDFVETKQLVVVK